MCVNVGIGVLGLSVLRQDAWCDIVDLADELEHWVVREVFERELALGHVPGIGLAENSVAVAGDDLARLEGRP